MSNWTNGYVADVDYTFGYYPDLNPLRAKLALVNQGFVCPNFHSACELGFGQGLSINIHASSSAVQWHGTDFNPSQASFAQELAFVSGNGSQLKDASFQDFVRQQDLPDFDFIGLHGIWSWISDENRRHIVDILRSKLKVGGVLYISYNTMPGWAAFSPVRHLLTEHADKLGAKGKGIVSRIDGALDFTEKLLATNPAYIRANPMVPERFNRIKEQNRHYLAHEYFNRDWHPMHFSAMAEWMAEAKLQYVCSANMLDHVDAINLTAEQQTLLNEIPDLVFRETVRDFMTNQQFRRDYWVKGGRRLGKLEQIEELRALKVVLCSHRSTIDLKVSGALGEANLSTDIYVPMLDTLSDYKARTLGQLEQLFADRGIRLAQVVQAVMLLTGMGHLALVQEESIQKIEKKHTDKINSHLCHLARCSGEISYLASPVTGGGIQVVRTQQLFLLALSQGKNSPEEWAQFVWDVLVLQGQRILKNGTALQSAEENLTELIEQAKTFKENKLPILKMLRVV